jgi:hypothetical protein
VIKFFDGRVLINFSSDAQPPFVAEDGYSMADAIIGLEPVFPHDFNLGLGSPPNGMSMSHSRAFSFKLIDVRTDALEGFGK